MQILLLLAGLVIVVRSQPRSIEAVRARGAGPPPATAEAPATRPDDGVPDVAWRTLAGLDYETGEMTGELEELVGREVWVPGFMVPLDDDARRVTEFLLVPYFGACVHTPPPPPNQLIHVRTPPGAPVEVAWWDPVQVRAELRLDPGESAYGEVSWSMTARAVEPFEP
jgi:hypothetical protein